MTRQRRSIARLAAGTETLLTHGGRDPSAQQDSSIRPIYRGSTVVFEPWTTFEDPRSRYRYGRQGTPLTDGI